MSVYQQFQKISFLVVYIMLIHALNNFKFSHLRSNSHILKRRISHILKSFQEVIIYNDDKSDSQTETDRFHNELKLIQSYRPKTTLLFSSNTPQLNQSIKTTPNNLASKRLWTVFDNSSSIQLDCIELPDFYISGKNQLTVEETVEKWNKNIEIRLQSLQKQSVTTSSIDSNSNCNKNNNNHDLSNELQHALDVVKLVSFMSRSLQLNLIGRPQSSSSFSSSSKASATINKNDKSPVTIADFAVQALIIDRLSHYFPHDKFIAEEDSNLFQSAFQSIANNNSDNSDSDNNTIEIFNKIKSILSQVTNEEWSNERLYAVLDRGSFDGFSYQDSTDTICNAASTTTTSTGAPSSSNNNNNNNRVWILDPIDGTKGFLRNQHYCIALALVINGAPQLSVLGCPNLNLKSVLEPVGYSNVGMLTNITKVGAIDKSFALSRSNTDISSSTTTSAVTAESSSSVTSKTINIFPPTSGTLFYAHSGTGAYAKLLNMPNYAGFEVNVDTINSMTSQSTSYAILCEATEATHGNRDVTQNIMKKLQLKNDFLRLDGQCKYGVVGCGTAHGNLRLPPLGYQEKIWDHVAGAHFVEEAGGKVTDLKGQKLDFKQFGRFLDPKITGIISSCGGKFHDLLLETVNKELEVSRSNNNSHSKPRVFGQE